MKSKKSAAGAPGARHAVLAALLVFAIAGCDPASEVLTVGGAIAVGTGGQALGSGGQAESGGTMTPSAGGAPETGGADGSGGQLATTTVVTDVPCEVVQVLSDHCWRCHGAMPNWGGPMALVQRSDFDAMGKLTAEEVVGSLVKERLHSEARPMPPVTEPDMPAAALATLDAWLDGGRPEGTGGTCEIAPVAKAEQPQTGGATTTPTESPGWPGGVVPEETCYQFLKHGGQGPDDDTPHLTPVGETYFNFFYKVPWTEPVVATRWRTVYDNTQVLHHWLLYQSVQPALRDGQSEIEIGTHPGAKLLGVWAVGGGDETFPDGVGLRMPPPGALLEVEWHLFNTTGDFVPDRSGLEICVVPESKVEPKFVAGVTWLGTEQLTIAPGLDSKMGGICNPSFKNGGPINIIKWMPHMHLLGRHMDTWLLRKDGTEEHVFSEPFLFDSQIMYEQNPPLIIEPGDRLHSECTFRNDTALPVVFGQSTNSEMCYQFAFAYPIGSLDGLVSPTLTGSDNTCLGFEAPHP